MMLRDAPVDVDQPVYEVLKARNWEPVVFSHPKHPHKKYRLSQASDLGTLVERYDTSPKPVEPWKRMLGLYRRVTMKLPIILRFHREYIFPLGKLRLALYILCHAYLGISSYLQAHLLGLFILEMNVLLSQRRNVVRPVLKRLFINCLLLICRRYVVSCKRDLKGRLDYRYHIAIQHRIMQAQSEFDAVSGRSSANSSILAGAKALLPIVKGRASSPPYEKAGSIVGKLANMVYASRRLFQLTGPKTCSLLLNRLLASTLETVWEFRLLYEPLKWKMHTSNPDYQRMTAMWELGTQTGVQEQVLGVRSWFVREYQAAFTPLPNASDSKARARKRQFALLTLLKKVNLYLLHTAYVMKRLPDLPALSGPNAGKKAVKTAAFLADLSAVRYAVGTFSRSLMSVMNDLHGYAGAVVAPVEQLYRLDTIKPGLKRLCGPQQLYRSKERLEGGSEAIAKGMSIRFTEVSFTYPGRDAKALDQVSFVIEAGELVSIVGFSGSGKSTVVALLCRWYEPDDGKIFINGVDIRHYEPASLFAKMSVLFQFTKLLNMTVGEYIKAGNTSMAFSDADVYVALRKSGAQKIVAELKHGLATPILSSKMYDPVTTVRTLIRQGEIKDAAEDETERLNLGKDQESEEEDTSTDVDSLRLLQSVEGQKITATDTSTLQKALRTPLPAPTYDERLVLSEGFEWKQVEDRYKDDSARFSGGEAKKIVLARSFLRPEVDLIILDEFSSNLDAVAEMQLFQQFVDDREGRTSVFVTHRLHLAAKSDRILFFSKGKLVEQGTHQELMDDKTSKYRKMYLAPTATRHCRDTGFQVEASEGCSAHTPEKNFYSE